MEENPLITYFKNSKNERVRVDLRNTVTASIEGVVKEVHPNGIIEMEASSPSSIRATYVFSVADVVLLEQRPSA